MPNNSMDLAVGFSVGGEREVRRALQALGKSVNETAKEIEHSGGSSEAAKRELEGLGEAFQKVGSLAGGATGEFTELAGSIAKFATGTTGIVAAITGVVAGLAGLTHHAAEAAAQIKDGAERAGTSVENYQGLAFAFQQSGSSAEGMERALGKISEAQGKALESSEDYGAAATKVMEWNEKMRASAEDYAATLSRINDDLGESVYQARRSQAESLYRLDLETEHQVAKNAKNAAQIRQDAEFRREMIVRDGALRVKEAEHRAQLERQRQAAEHYRKQQQALRQHNLEMEKDAENAAKSLDKFTKFGVNLLDGGKVRDTVEVFKDVAHRLADIENPAERASKAVDLFGRRFGTQLLPLMAEGRGAIDKFIDEAKDLGIILDTEQVKIGKEFGDSFEKMLLVIGRSIDRVFLKFAPGFQKLTDALSETLGHSGKTVGEWAGTVAQKLEPLFNDLANLIRGDLDKINSGFLQVAAVGLKTFGAGVKLAFEGFKQFANGLYQALDLVAKSLQAMGFNVSAADLAAFGVAVKIAIPLVRALAAGFMALSFAASPWIVALRAAIAAAVFLFPFVTENFPGVVKAFQEGAAAIGRALKPVVDMIHAIGSFFGIGAGGSPAAEAAIPGRAIGGIGGTGSGYDKYGNPAGMTGGLPTEEGHAAGGMIRGGRGGIDDIPARLTAGEFVMRKSAVERYGAGFMQAINTQRFALGGLVRRVGEFAMPSAPLHFAGGGLVAAGAGGGKTPIHLHLGGQSYMMHADDQVAGALVRHAAGRQMRSGGPKPSWFGS